MNLAAVLLGAYLIGSFPTAYLAGRYVQGIDIRRHGSGNMGTMNAKAILGWRWAIIVFLFDVLKGILAVCLSFPSGIDPILAASAAAAGHCYPVWLGFRGGKGLATALGAVITTGSYWIIAVFAAGWALMLAYYRLTPLLTGIFTKMTAPDPAGFSDRANLLGITALMLFAILCGPDWWLILLTVIISSRLIQSIIANMKTS